MAGLLSALGTGASSVVEGATRAGGKALSSVNWGSVASKAPGAIQGTREFSGAVNEGLEKGRSLPGALLSGTAQSVFGWTHPVASAALNMAPTAANFVDSAYAFRRRRAEEIIQQTQAERGVVGGGYQDTQQAQTMRQAALQQIQGNKLNARSALGGEARIFSNRRYTG